MSSFQAALIAVVTREFLQWAGVAGTSFITFFAARFLSILVLNSTADFPYLVTPLDAITNRSKSDNTSIFSTLSDSDLDAAADTATGKDVAFVFITADSGEAQYTVEGNAGDRNDLQAWHGGVS